MKIQKYKIGDMVWRMENEKAVEQEITAVALSNYESFKGFNYYFRKPLEDAWYGWRKESDIFPTKEELLKSL